MANKHILRIHETESDLLSELKDKQIAWATDINEAIWRNGNNFYYIEASKYWNGSEFIEINSDQIYNVYNWDDYLTALSDVGNIKYIYMRENIQAPSVLTQNIDVYGQCEIIVYTGSQIFSFDPSGASNCELRYRGASGSPNFTSLNFLGNSMAYVGFETLFIEDVYCRNEDIISSLPIDVQITNGAELGTPKFQYESQDGNFTCSVGTSDFIRELWTVPIFEIETIGSAEGYKPKGTDFLNNGSSVYSNMSQADISENFVGDVYTDAFLGLIFTTSQLSGLLRKRFIGGSVLWSFNNLDVWNPSTFSDNPISFIGRGIDFTSGVSIDEDKLCSLTLAPSTSNATLKIGDITDTQNDIYVEVINIDGDVTLDPTSTHNIYYEKINLNGFTLTDSGNVAVQQFWNNTNDSSGGGSPGGSNTQVQFNDGGAFGGDAGFTYNKTTNSLSITGDFSADGKVSFDYVDVGLAVSSSNYLSSWGLTPPFVPISAGRAAFVGRDDRNELNYLTNAYYDGTAWKSITSGYATRITQNNEGKIQYFTYDSPSAGSTITWNNVFEISEDGDVQADGKISFDYVDVGLAVSSSNYLSSWGLTPPFIPISVGRAAFVGRNDRNELNNLTNAYYDGTAWKSITSGQATRISQSNEGDLQYFTYNAPSAGSTITWTNVFSINSDGDIDTEGVLNLGSTTNATPSNANIWYDGTSINIQGDVTCNESNFLVEKTLGFGSSFNKAIRLGASNDASVNVGESYKWDFLVSGDQNGQDLSFRKWVRGGTQEEVLKLDSDGNATFSGDVACNIPTGTQVGLVGYDANGKLIQGTGGGGVTPGAWTNVTLASNISVRSGYRPLRYRSDGIDGVQVEGTCKYNTGFNLAPGFTVVLFTFASGSRPNNDFNVKAQVGYNGATTEIDAWAHIDASTGQVTLKNSDAIAISELYDISFNFRFSLT